MTIGFFTAPTVLFNTVLGLASEHEIAVRGPDRLAVILPMYEEEGGAQAALLSVLAQRTPADSVAVSVNGGTDATAHVVAGTLRSLGYVSHAMPNPTGRPARVVAWRRPEHVPVTVVEFDGRTGKAECINTAIASGLVSAERVLVVDGDTVLDPGFIAALKDGFYRARVEMHAGRRRWVLEDVALQSGAAASREPTRPTAVATFISRARAVEYAFSAVLRRGQTRRLGSSRVFGRSRLYTVVGCGFAARSDAFPVPTDTLTEDHDLTLAVQNGSQVERTTDAASLAARGFGVVVGGRIVDPRTYWGSGTEIVLRRGGDARFVSDAVMHTQDPPHVSGYVRQVERWMGGGIQNALKRFLGGPRGEPSAPNVRFAALTAQAENVLGLALLALLPIVLGLRLVDPTSDRALLGLGLVLWFGLDLALSAVAAGVGFQRIERARGARGTALAWRVVRGVLLGVGPHVMLKYLHAVCYVAAASRVVPDHVRRHAAMPPPTVTWERPHQPVRNAAHARTLGIGFGMTTYALVGVLAVVSIAPAADEGARDAWQRTRGAPVIEVPAYVGLPVHRSGPALEPAIAVLVASWAEVVPDPAGPSGGPFASHYCPPHVVAAAASEPRRLDDDGRAFEGLSPWGLLTLARLVPLLALLEEAATAYDVPARLLLQVLLNESFLDPLAHGPTDDVGLSQVTADALTLLRSLSTDPGSGLANPRLVGLPFTLYDPDFSMCAGAAKLAWARALPGGEDDGVAYARYVNPLHGVVDGRVSARHAPLVAAFEAVGPLADAMAAVVAAYRQRPEAVDAQAGALLAVADDVAAGVLDLEGAYRRTAALVERFGIRDGRFYAEVLEGLYGVGREEARGDRATVMSALAASHE